MYSKNVWSVHLLQLKRKVLRSCPVFQNRNFTGNTFTVYWEEFYRTYSRSLSLSSTHLLGQELELLASKVPIQWNVWSYCLCTVWLNEWRKFQVERNILIGCSKTFYFRYPRISCKRILQFSLIIVVVEN